MKSVNRELLAWTGKGILWWIAFIGGAIGRRSKSIKGESILQSSRPDLWLGDLSKQVWDKVHDRIPKEMDENIVCGKLLSLILTAWTYRLIRAKSHDPRRPIRVRRRMMRKLAAYSVSLLGCLTDDSMDTELFPSQEWDPPFAKSARYEPDAMELARQTYAKKPNKVEAKR